MTLDQLAIRAVRTAARLRMKFGYGKADALCPFDLADRLGVIVHLVALASLEGMYSPDPKPTILVSAERPSGRRRYTCSHELGHHVFGHGTHLEELGGGAVSTWSPQEYLANRFAAALLMPKLAVESAFSCRGWSITDPTVEEIFAVAQALGVGFTTLVGYLESTLKHMSSTRAAVLRKTSLPRLRSQLGKL